MVRQVRRTRPSAPRTPHIRGTLNLPGIDSGPRAATTRSSGGGSLRVWDYVADQEFLATGRTLVDIVDDSRAAVDVRLSLARTEVELNVGISTARP